MTAHRPARVGLLGAGLTGLAVALPFSPSDGGGRQWDNLVLAAVALVAAWRSSRVLRARDQADRRTWQLLTLGAVLFGVASLVTGLGVSPAFGEVGLGDLLLIVSACVPPAVCALLALRVRRTRWSSLVLDGLTVTLALLTIADIVVLDPALHAGVLPAAAAPLALAYAGFAAVAVGLAGALCTVSTAALQRAATLMIVVTGLISLAALMLALGLVHPSPAVQAVGDTACILAMEAGFLAVRRAPRRTGRTPAESQPRVNPAGLAITLTSLGGLPVTLGALALLDRPVPGQALAGCAAVITLLLLRMVARIKDTGRIREDLVRSEQDFRGLVEASSDGVAIVDADLRLEFTSPAARTLLGVPDSDLHPVLLDLLHEEDRARIRLELTGPIGAVTPSLQLRVPDAAGEPRELEVTHHERPGSGRRVLHLRDVTTRRRRERELERMAFTDHLTRLPNRAMLFQEMAAPSTADRCLLVLDLDGFKAVNDTAGHESGDLLLVEVARRLQGLLRADDLVARLGGDEFAVLMAGDEEAAIEAAQRVVEVLGHGYRVGARSFSVGASVGLCRVHPGGGQLAFRQADTALRAAKQAGKGCWRVHTEDRVALAAATSDVAAALADGEVQLRFDAIANGDTGILSAVHAEPVWVHGELGVLPAPELWAAAERQGQTAALQQWLLTQACADAAALDDRLLVTVDLPAGLVHADELPGEVAGALAAAGLVPRRLTLCFTEEVLQTSSAALIPALQIVHEAGVRLGLTDYGMGATLWSQLARLPVDVIMVDVRDLSSQGNSDRVLPLLGAIARSARTFDVDTVATQIAGPEMLAELRMQGLVAVAGPVLPSGLTAPQVAGLLRHPSSAVVAPLPMAHARV